MEIERALTKESPARTFCIVHVCTVLNAEGGEALYGSGGFEFDQSSSLL